MNIFSKKSNNLLNLNLAIDSDKLYLKQISQLETELKELSGKYEKLKEINENDLKENNMNLLNIMRNEFDDKISFYKKANQK